jgi:serine/threonine-protein kinase Chk1
MVREFIEGWDLLQILGEGTFADVKLLVNRASGEACAMKEIHLSLHPDETREAVKKEICVHKLLKHKNVVQCYGSRIDKDRQFIFLEYCSGGELFDKIEPEIGMPEHQAQHLFLQLLDALEYIHERGITHRDIKPENLLLTDGDVLKLSDFGLATVFRHKGKERLLEKRCGTMPYIAPEIIVKSKYRAEPADLWSAGMVLLAMLVGELPWDMPTSEEPTYESWRNKDCSLAIWQRLDNLPLSLLRKILNPSAVKRATLEQIRQHLWCRKTFKDKDGHLIEPELVTKPLKRTNPDYCFNASQPAFEMAASSKSNSYQQHPQNFEFPSFSQPAMEHLSNGAWSTQTQTQGSSTQTSGPVTVYQKLVKRMTRFWTDETPEAAMKHIKGVTQKLGYNVEVRTPGMMRIQLALT